MKYNDLRRKIKDPVFSLQDLRIAGLKVWPYQLTKWVESGYIIKLRNGVYAFADKASDLQTEHVALKIYQPSYISLEWALFRYGLIPDVVHNCTSVTTKNSKIFKNQIGSFIYRKIKIEMFFGYKKIENNGQVYLIAEPEKAIIDFIYLNSDKIKNIDDIKEMRFNPFVLQKMRQGYIRKYAKIIQNKELDRILKLLFE